MSPSGLCQIFGGQVFLGPGTRQIDPAAQLSRDAPASDALGELGFVSLVEYALQHMHLCLRGSIGLL